MSRFIAQLLYNQPWMILPGKLEEIQAAFELYSSNGNATGFESFAPTENDDPYTTASGVRVIPMRGTMAKRGNLIQQASGGVSMEIAGKEIMAAASSDHIKAIVLDIDSPGGTVDGAFTLSDIIYAAREKKPVVAFADGAAASAAYLAASSAHKIVGNATSVLGSIGVFMTHTDRSIMNKMVGLKKTIIKAGKFKALGNMEEPLSDDAHAIIQGDVDTMYSMFVASVARNRGVSTQVVLSTMAEGQIFIGKAALDVGLMDMVGERGDAIALAESLSKQQGVRITPHRKAKRMENLSANIELVLDGKADSIEDEAERTAAQAAVNQVRRRGTERTAESLVTFTESEIEATASALDHPAIQALIEKKAAEKSSIELERRGTIKKACSTLGLDAKIGQALIDEEVSVSIAQARLIQQSATENPPLKSNHTTTAPPDGNESGEDNQKAHIERGRAYAKENDCSMADAMKATVAA